MLADRFIHDSWDDGNGVDKESSHRYAAEILLHIRKAFYDGISKQTIAALAAGTEPEHDPPKAPYTQKLTLENMRWLFEVKVKLHTDFPKRDLPLQRMPRQPQSLRF
jgi:hypothetical protein